jgi:hypothetical protein
MYHMLSHNLEVPGGCTMPGGSATAGGRKPKTTQTKALAWYNKPAMQTANNFSEIE